jgi:probable HAF family extracellular repeat protein
MKTCITEAGGRGLDQNVPYILPALSPYDDSQARAINNAGAVTGFSAVNSPFGKVYHPFLWTPGGGMIDLNIGAPGDQYYGEDINDSNVIVSSRWIWHPASAVSPAGYTSIPLPAGAINLAGYSINNSGNVAGSAWDGSTHPPFIYKDGVTSYLARGGTPYHLNNRNDALGDASNYNAPVFWSSSGALTTLPILSSLERGWSAGLNDRGEIIGAGRGSGWYYTPMYWKSPTDQPVDLNSLVDLEDGWSLIDVQAINNLGAMVGYADFAELDYPAYVITPMPQLAVDANRDGVIHLPTEPVPPDLSDATSPDRPFRFWLNDDIDRQHTVDGNDSEEDDIGGSEHLGMRADSAEDRVQSKRDLEDYARLWISTQGLNDAFKDESNPLSLGLQWTNTGGTTPAIKIVKHVEPDGGTKYLTDEAMAQQQSSGASAAAVVGANTFITLVDASDTNGKFFVLPKSLFSGLSESAPKTYLLFEGVQAGKGQLRLVILKKEGSTYTKIGDGPGVWMDLKSIEDFYERWTVGDTDGGVPWTTASRKKVQLSASGNAIGHSDGFAYDGASPEERKYILYVHGWNMQPWEKNRFAETMFKRLYWQGYKGRFGIFCWPTTYAFEPPLSAILDGTNYDRGEWTAWRAAAPLKNLLVNLHSDYSNQVYVMAHSMGNVVTGEALRLATQQGSGQLVSTYVASQAAVPAHCYDGGRAEDIAAVFGFWTSIGRTFDGSTFPQTPNVYPDWLAGNGAAVGTRVNFYNESDYALWHDVWELNQFFKPDHPDGSEQPWHYSYEDDLGAPPTTYSSFIRFDHYDDMANPVGIHDLQLGSGADVQDRHEIMAFASEARTKAVGAATALPNFNPVNLQAIWPGDNQSVKLHDGLDYSAHKWHSAQFRSTNMRQKGYWQTLLGDQGFNLLTTP